MKRYLTLFAVLAIASCNQSEPKTQSTPTKRDTFYVDTFETSRNNHQQPQPVEQSTEKQAPIREIMTVRIQNSLMETDKSMACYSTFDEESKVLTMEAMRSNDMFKLAYEGGGIFTIYLYNNGELEASKNVYRRDDLETSEREHIYTSRTGEIVITLSYN